MMKPASRAPRVSYPAVQFCCQSAAAPAWGDHGSPPPAPHRSSTPPPPALLRPLTLESSRAVLMIWALIESQSSIFQISPPISPSALTALQYRLINIHGAKASLFLGGAPSVIAGGITQCATQLKVLIFIHKISHKAMSLICWTAKRPPLI